MDHLKSTSIKVISSKAFKGFGLFCFKQQNVDNVLLVYYYFFNVFGMIRINLVVKEKYMNFEIIGNIAYITSDSVLIKDSESALDLMATVKYETKCEKIILEKSLVTEDFFK